MKQNNEFLRKGITYEYLNEALEYKNGILYWKLRPAHHFTTKKAMITFNNNIAGKEAGSLNKDGYKIIPITFNGKKHNLKAHRVIWYMLNKEVPYIIDHINRNRGDNRIENLRNVSYWENRLNSSVFKGASFDKKQQQWVARYRQGKKYLHLGYFNSEWEAIQAYRAKVLEHRGVDLNRQNVLQDIENWFDIAKPITTNKDLVVQLSCIFEEEVEFLQALNIPEADNAIRELTKFYEMLRKSSSIDLTKANRIALADACADIKVTLIGLAYMLNMDIEGALVEVNKSNYSKFENGKPVLNEFGKIMKGKNYFKPNLTKFV